ncbi:TPA: hypothetical protein QDC51_001226 [Burkholderia multivorans]|uniref:hypothetical protein n=1 Tax=Burkholderia multivorans TaxID=87883 RepID=UPI001C2204BD|nr:hypothetical protein [Burkholderia multivorans]MBU9351697.1 hypothetical protein [Burkholderia multivorans]MBU9394948.1 hypothetical protein [Burkholderia multivorans]HDR9834468.1 hypothetical protein [Burkholderia multivorans]HDR9840412.1 hypothetical protein [Burkholderia multivorans]HDR9846415.1 hypothetical protein [Burkholderia multivorans]
MTHANSCADALTDEQLATLKQTALAATPQNIDSAESIDHYTDGRYIECPCCSGEGTVELEADFLNYDGKALGVQFYGIGNEPGAAEAYFRSASPATILALLARLERAEAALGTSATETGAQGATEQFIVIGHGESDIPEAKIVARRADVLDAVLSMIYGGPCPDDAMRAEYASMLGDWDGDHWNVTFEIGGIDVWRVGLWRSHAMASAAPADERAIGMPDEVRDSLMDSRYLAGVTAGWNAANADDPNAALKKIHDAYSGYLKPLRDWQKAGRPGARATPATADERAAFERHQGYPRPEYDGPAQEAWDYHRKTWNAALNFAARAAASPAAEPVAYCVPNKKSGKPEWGKDWMFSPIRQGKATMPLYAAPQPAPADTIQCQAHSGPGCTECGGTGIWPAQADAPAEARELPMMRKAFRVTEVSGDPDPAKQRFYMRFSFPSIEALHAADDEWRKFVAAPVSAPADAGEARLTDEQRAMLTQAADFLELKHSRLAAVALRALLNGADHAR